MPQFANQTPTPGWTSVNQGSTTVSPDVEQGFGANDMLVNPALQYGYVAWSMVPEDAITNVAWGTTNTNYLTRVFCAQSAVVSKVDFFPVLANGITSFQVGLYGATGTQLSTTTAITTFTGWSSSQQTATLLTPTVLVSGNFYYVASVAAWATTSPTFAGCQGATGASLNAGVTLALNVEAESNGTAAALPASYTLGSGTFTSFEHFYALH